MKSIQLVSALLLSCLVSASLQAHPSHRQDVNPVIGNISYYAKFHRYPDASVDEQLRLTTHLEFVENLLRKRDVSHLTAPLRNRRALMLDLLHTYRTNGVFPRNYDYPGIRIPCFIDRDGRICAVGYLVEKTAGRDVAEELNRKFQYFNLMDMHDAVLEQWVSESGLTLKECAMIQPAYGYYDDPIPNPGMEDWTPVGGTHENPLGWMTNNTAQYNQHIVKNTDSYSGTYAMQVNQDGFASSRFIYRHFPGFTLQFYVKSSIAAGDTATIELLGYTGGTASYQAVWHCTSTLVNWTVANIQLGNEEIVMYALDSIEIRVRGGRMNGTSLLVDQIGQSQLGLPGENFRWSLYPNPMTESAVLEIGNGQTGAYELVLYGLKGEQVYTMKNLAAGSNLLQRGNLAAGLYTYHLRKENTIVASGKLLMK